MFPALSFIEFSDIDKWNMKSRSNDAQPAASGLQTQKVDIVASFLMSTLIIVAGLVLLLFVHWLTQAFTWQSGSIVVEQERVAGRGDHAAGFERDIEPPGMEEAEELSEPVLEKSLESVSEVASTVAASLESIDSEAVKNASGTGRGDSRPPGPLGEGDDVVPRFERWELKFQAKGLKDYAEQLDFYKIELACVGGGVNSVEYASQLAGSPQKRTGSSEEENRLQRLYFMWRTNSPLKQYEAQMLTQAGIRTQGRQQLKFIPKELESKLAEIEMLHAKANGHNSVTEIAKTVFQSQPESDGYRFSVASQHYRTPSKASSR